MNNLQMLTTKATENSNWKFFMSFVLTTKLNMQFKKNCGWLFFTCRFDNFVSFLRNFKDQFKLQNWKWQKSNRHFQWKIEGVDGFCAEIL